MERASRAQERSAPSSAVAKTRCKLEPKYQSRFLSKRTFVSLTLPRLHSPRTTLDPTATRRTQAVGLLRASGEHLSPRCSPSSRPLSSRTGPQKGMGREGNCHRQVLLLPWVNEEMQMRVFQFFQRHHSRAYHHTYLRIMNTELPYSH